MRAATKKRRVSPPHTSPVSISPTVRPVEGALNELGIGVPSPTKTSYKQGLKRDIKDFGKRGLFFIYRMCQRVGWNVFPLHYYTSEPDIALLEHQRSFWIGPSAMKGVDMPLTRQINLLKKVSSDYRKEFEGNLALRAGIAGGYGPGYGEIEAQCLHSVIRYYQPARVVEVGSGVSTICTLTAAKLNSQENPRHSFQITCIEPFPKPNLLRLAERERSIKIRKEFVQGTPPEIFEELEKDDILFIDSSHVVKAGSDVTHLILEVLPTLKSGVIVHIHDIYLPYEYQRDVLQTFIHANETSLVHAFLIYNQKFEVMFSLSHLHYLAPNRMKEFFPKYNPQPSIEGLEKTKRTPQEHFPSSIWLKVR